MQAAGHTCRQAAGESRIVVERERLWLREKENQAS